MTPGTRLIRNWLLKPPKPHSLRVTSGDDTQTLEFGNQKYAAIAASIEALDPDKIEALDPNGKLIRAIKAEQFEEPASEDDDGAPTAAAKTNAKQLEREMAMLSKFGELLADAYKHSTTIAFGKMVELFDATAKRGESLEKSLAATERLLRRAYEEGAGNKEEGEPSLLETMMSTFVAGQKDGSVEKAIGTAAGKSNGKTTNGKVQI
jgi:hypothetical protein